MKEGHIPSSVREVPPSSSVVCVQAPLPLSRALANVHGGFFALRIDTGRQVLHARMEEGERRGH